MTEEGCSASVNVVIKHTKSAKAQGNKGSKVTSVHGLCFALCVFLTLGGSARADPTISFGPAVPGQSIEQVVNSMPDARWRFFHDPANEALVGAVASDAIEF